MKAAPPEDRQRIIDLYKSGMTRPAIARETGWSEGTVHNIIKASGIVGAGRVTGVRTDPETEALIVALYEQGTTWREIMQRTGRTEHTVQAVIKRNGSRPNRKGEVTSEARRRIPQLYAEGLGAPEIGRMVGCETTSVYTLLEQLGIDRREQVACENPGYFDQIDGPAKAYWLGFIAADGCVTGSKYPRLQIKLARKDRDHLLLLHGALRANRPLWDSEQFSSGKLRPYSTLAVYSPPLARALMQHGITPRKSATLQPWRGPAELMPHYWRGLFDGDGSITINRRGVYLSFVGSEAVAKGFLGWAHEVCGTNSTARQGKPGSSYWVVQIGGSLAARRFPYATPTPLRLLAALYDDAPVALARKKALADLAVHGKPLQAAMF
jgi:DNA invertase Pin-like site-specific DNA recombinase